MVSYVSQYGVLIPSGFLCVDLESEGGFVTAPLGSLQKIGKTDQILLCVCLSLVSVKAQIKLCSVNCAHQKLTNLNWVFNKSWIDVRTAKGVLFYYWLILTIIKYGIFPAPYFVNTNKSQPEVCKCWIFNLQLFIYKTFIGSKTTFLKFKLLMICN